MRVFYLGNFIDVEIGQKVTIARSSSGHTMFGEPAEFSRTTKQHAVFTTESGATIKCPIENWSYTIGKADKAGYGIITRKFEDVKNIIRMPVML